jgi:hypothetical protein
MKYLVQIRFNGAEAVIHRLPADEQHNITMEFQAIRKLPGVLDGNQLEPAGTAKTVRVNDGQTLISDGPGADDAAAINGYYILDAPDLDAAIGFAARIPVARMGGTVEVRAMMER